MNAAVKEKLEQIRARRDQALEDRITRRLKDLPEEALDRISVAIVSEKGSERRIKREGKEAAK